MQPSSTLAPRRLMHDVLPPYAPASTGQASTQAPPPSASPPPPPIQPSAPPPASQPSVSSDPIPVKTQSSTAQPMFPVAPQTASAATAAAPAGPAVPAADSKSDTLKPQAIHQAAKNKTGTNWAVIVLAIIVSLGLAGAAYWTYVRS